MEINIKKCKIMTYSRNEIRINYNYNINNSDIERVDVIKDLGIHFDDRLSFDYHCNHILTTANKRWINIVRNCKDFKNPQVFKTMYTSLVRSVITYGSVIWRPNRQYAIKKFEKLQHKVFRKIAYVQGRPIHRFSHDYSDIAKDLGLPSIESFFDYADMSFLYKTFKENTCNSFISLFNVNDSAYK